ncbi:maleylpyruvate isomerase N-terminal domain-containing protein [Streptomyces sp. KMM 9044]|uniref:maleylpyruvate isomerase N-terminal domain-containing protein n=1 Tax=Streptomyces sp. KMM 9044 TaxID=2744474 RepID=UPI002151E614|nr:maleylpyruvate isomerase N-terminal domain-containing protein [Streptomyces sp. KMM 9044]WAX79472.1 maleylpyruvate isomerase N-terminal domain-containing protein [Streptomyces sp. KMM 9044]
MSDDRFKPYDDHEHEPEREQKEQEKEPEGGGEPHGDTDAGPRAGSGTGADGTPERDVPGSQERAAGSGRPARVPPRTSVEDPGQHLPAVAPEPESLTLEHRVLKSLLGAWALAACAPEEATAVEEHLCGCGACAEEALRLRDAVGLLQRSESLDLGPGLRTRVLESCLKRRPPRVPVPDWAAAYEAETARLDALLQDFGDTEWHAPVRLRWYEADEAVTRRTTIAGVIAHLMAVDGLVATALGLADPLGDLAPGQATPSARTEAFWRGARHPPTRSVRAPWRAQSHDLVRTVSFTDHSAGRMPVSYGGYELPLHDAMLDRAFECWVHGEDIAEAVDYPYEPPTGRHLHGMVDLAARMLPAVLEARRQAGQEVSTGRRLVAAGAPGRSLRLEIEGSGGGEWLIPLDSPAAKGSAEHEVAHIALDGSEFCRLAAGHVSPQEAAAGQVGDKAAIRDVLLAAASMSRI